MQLAILCLIAISIPLAAVLMRESEEGWSSLFALVYSCAVGLLLSASVIVDEASGLSAWFAHALRGYAL
jgi:hypothetical protein